MSEMDKLKESEERFRIIFENAADGVFVADADGVFTDVNASGCRLLGYEPGELVGKSIVEMLPPQEIARFFDTRESLLAGDTKFEEWTLLHRDGSLIETEISSQMLPDGHLLAFVRDITERRKTEESNKRQARHTALRAEVQAAFSSGEGSLQSIMQSNMESLVRHMNIALARIWLLDEESQVLELQASAGLYTHIDGKHSRFKVGQYKIGKIAARKEFFYSNTILKIEPIDKAWAKREGLVSFAGFPLIVNDKVVGVVGVFSRHCLMEDTLEEFKSIAALLAQGIVRKKAEDSLREKQELLQAFFDFSTELIHVKDLEGRCLMTNRVFEEVLQLSGKDCYGKTEIELWQASPTIKVNPRRSVEDYRDFDIEVLKTGKIAQKEEVFMVGDEQRIFSTIKKPLNDAAGKPYVIFSISTDITERKRAEDKLRAEQQLLQSIIDNSTALIHVKDLNNRLVLVNKSFADLLQIAPEQMLGKNHYEMWELSPVAVDKSDIDSYRAFDAEVLTAGKPLQKELSISSVGGEKRYFLVTKSLLCDESGKPNSICTVATEITEIKRAEKELRRLQNELAHATRVMTIAALTTSIAHEINQPLAAVVTNGNAALRWLAMDPPNLLEARDAVNRIIRDGIRAGGVIERTRTILKKAPPDKKPLDINEIAEETIALAQYEIQKNKIFLETRFSTTLPRVEGDKIQIQQVLLNLLMNAIEAVKAAPNNEAQLSVETNQFESDNITVAVKDSGIGFKGNDIDRIFDSFYTTKEEGMGMGLSISRSIIEAHGGQLRATANKTKGATVQFTLPVRVSE